MCLALEVTIDKTRLPSQEDACIPFNRWMPRISPKAGTDLLVPGAINRVNCLQVAITKFNVLIRVPCLALKIEDLT